MPRYHEQGKHERLSRVNLVFTAGKVCRGRQAGFRGAREETVLYGSQGTAPFDVEICRISAGKTPYPYHSHSAQWEFYHVISGKGIVRHKDGTTPIEAGDAFLFQPDEPHQVSNDGSEDLVLYVVADNPIGESGYFPDSKKWIVRSPERQLIRSENLDYFDGEE